MAQKTNLNVNPYFDDFDANKNFYKVLFKPGKPVQARELNTVQAILQNQIETFGSNYIKEGSPLVSGISYDQDYCAVKLNQFSFGVDISLYIEKYVGSVIRGEVSGVSAVVKQVVFPNNEEVEYITLYVKYLDSNSEFDRSSFSDGESLLSTQPISYGINNVVIADGVAFASLISENATAVGSSASVDNGAYFVRGFFVNVSKQTLILDYYTNTPSYRVGFRVSESVVTAKEDSSLYDNAKGFTNFAAPGADRFSLKLTLVKKPLTNNENDTDFIELMRVEDGFLKKLQTQTDYNKIKDYIAERTYDESGNYTVTPFKVSVNNSLNNLLGNNGLFLSNEFTNEGNTPNDDIMCISIDPGKAYVKGYDITKVGTTILDVDKPRDVEKISNVVVPFTMGNIIRVNNVYGAPINRSVVSFYDQRRNNDLSTPQGIKVGEARVYCFRLTDSPYSSSSSLWDLYFYDPQFYTILTLNNSISSSELPASSIVTGSSSGAIGYVVNSGSTDKDISVRQISGKFLKNESLIINGVTSISRSIANVKEYKESDIKSVYQNDPSSSVDFIADAELSSVVPPGFSTLDEVTISSSGLVTPVNKPVSGITTGAIIKYSISGFSTETYNVVTSISPNQLSFTVAGITTIQGVCDGALPSSDVKVRLVSGTSKILNQNSSYLYSVLPNTNIESVDLSTSQLTFCSQAILNTTVTNNSLSLSTADFTLPQNYGAVKFDTFDVEKYSIHYSDGTTERLRYDQVSFNIDYTTITFTGIQNKTLALVNGTFIKTGIQSKTKIYKKSNILEVNLSKYPQSGINTSSSIGDGLTYNQYYGLRVQDNEICLRYPDVTNVLAVYESLDEGSPSFDSLNFSSLYSVNANSIIGENIIGSNSNAIGRIVGKSSNTVEFIYLNANKFEIGEDVTFESSNISAPIESIAFGKYKNITYAFKLDKGHRNEFCDYSRLIRNNNQPEPSRRLKVVFDYFDVPSTDIGDVFTILSYPSESYNKDIPKIGYLNIRSSDTLDFRPRVSYFSGNLSSPFSFSSRNFDNSIKVIITPNEASLISYNVYLGRIDKICLDSLGAFTIKKGVSSLKPSEPLVSDELLEIASINLPPYLYDPSDAKVTMVENKRYTMKDIGKIENRVENLERVTSLSLLELQTQTLQIKDADGIDRFKTGFFADSLKDDSFINLSLSLSQRDEENNELIPLKSRNTLKNLLIPTDSISNESLDLSTDFVLTDVRTKKRGRIVTLDYDEIPWIEQSLATRVNNVNPFHVIQYVGDIKLNPTRDTWIRTVELPDRVIVQNNSLNLQSQVTTERLTLNRVDNTSGARTSGGGNTGSLTSVDTFTSLSLSDARPARSESFTSSDSSESSSTERAFVESNLEEYIRSRNVEFSVSNLKSFTRYYPFFDGLSTIDIVPKLIEVTSDRNLLNPGTDGSFRVGEVVYVFARDINISDPILTFRLAAPNHKFGPHNNPTQTFQVNPYQRDTSLPSQYSSSTPILNVDTFALSEEASGDYSGFIKAGSIIIGATSNAIAFVKDIRLVTDNYGDLIGSFFIQNPNNIPAPISRFKTGTKSFRLSSSPTNQNGLLNNSDVSSAETTYTAEGSVQSYQNIVRISRVNVSLTTSNNIMSRTLTETRSESITSINLPPPVVNNITNTTNNITNNNITNTTNVTNVTNVTRNVRNITRNFITYEIRTDPLAQSFLVGNGRGLNSFFDDANGVFLTSIDLFFAKKDSNNAPVTVQIRPVDDTPSLVVIGDSVTLRPDQINVSSDASIATKVTFPYPIFLAPNQEYSIVLLAPQSDQYEVWCARMGEKTVNTANLPDSESVRYTRQFAIGSLFKSQNGSIWSADQYEDMKFKLYKAKFNTSEGIAYFQNPTLNKNNTYIRKLVSNPIRTLPRKLRVGIHTIHDSGTITGILTAGRKVSENIDTYRYAYIVGTGSSVVNVAITTGGNNYPSGISTVQTFNINGNGTGLQLQVTAGSSGSVSSVSILNPGSGYSVGDVVGIVTSTVTGTSNSAKGTDAQITISSANEYSVDTLYLTNAQANGFTIGSGSKIEYFNNLGSRTPIAIATITSSSQYGGEFYNGSYFKVDHFTHGMYAANNVVQITGVFPNTAGARLTSTMSITDSSLNIPSGDVSKFKTFEGANVSPTYPGYILINNEILEYTAITESGTITVSERSIDNTISLEHQSGSLVYKYELSGVSLRRINNIKHNIVDNSIDLDSYYIQIDRGGLIDDQNIGESRTSDNGTYPLLSFNEETSVGSNSVYASENIVYDTIIPHYDIGLPGESTKVRGLIRTISGTSASGNEESFVDLGYEPIELNVPNKLNSLRLIASKVNSDTYLGNMPRNKSMTTAIVMSTTNYNLSPIIFLDTTFTEYDSCRLNRPISDFASDGRVNGIIEDPHAATYISKVIRLTQPSNTLKIFLSAYRHSSADIRVLYSLIRPSSEQSNSSFNLFPGYNNLTSDNNLDGYLDVIDESKNDGLPDIFVPDSLDNQFLEYQYTAANVGPFIGFTIKIIMSGTRQDKYPRLKDIRAIALG
jgi:hypothetical protein